MLIEASDCFFGSLNRFIDCIGEETIQVASCLSALAVTFFHMDELRKSLEYQEKSHTVLTTISQSYLSQPWYEPLQAQVYDQYLQNSKELLNHYATQCIQREKALLLNQQHMTSRQYKRAMSRQTPPTSAPTVNANAAQLNPYAGMSFLDFLEYNNMVRSTLIGSNGATTRLAKGAFGQRSGQSSQDEEEE